MNSDFRVYAGCSGCGSALEIAVLSTQGPLHVVLEVRPCPRCLEAVEDKAREEERVLCEAEEVGR